MITPGIATDKQLKLFKMLLLVDQLRGEHATGIMKINRATNKVAIHKKALSATDFLSLDETKKFLDTDRGQIYVGHNRYATMGKRDDSGAHPFQADHITMVHNGSVDFSAISKLSKSDDKDVTVDSEMVCHTIAERGISVAVKEYLAGAFSLVWWNDLERSINFVRNKERPMYYAFLNDGTMVWASEAAFISLVVDRDKTLSFTKNGKPDETIINAHYRWSFDERGNFENKGKPHVSMLNFAKVPERTYRGWNNYYGLEDGGEDLLGGRTIRGSVRQQFQRDRTPSTDILADDGSHLGNKQYKDSRDAILGKLGIPWKMGDRMAFVFSKFDGYSQVANFEEKGCLNGSMRWKDVTCEVTAYGLKREETMINGSYCTNFVGTITNVFTRSINGRQTTCITVANVCISDIDPLKVASRTPRVIVNNEINFPLKTDGKTFTSSVEFMEFVKCGCAVCGNIPTPWNIHNRSLSVHPVPAGSPSNAQPEYICGKCNIADQKAIQNLRV